MDKIKIGFVGLGNMGTAMARNLLGHGFPLFIYNRTRQKERDLVKLGAISANDLRHLSQVCDVVITMVSDDAAVEEIYNGSDGLLADPSPGILMVDMSTVSPQTSKSLAESCRHKSIRFLEAKVSGSVKPAEDGQLVIMASGEFADYKKTLPVFDVLGKRSFYLGEVGKASTAKLAINYFLALTLQGLAETVLFAKQQNVYVADMLSLINESALGSGITRLKSHAILDDNFSPAFALKHITKDLRLVQKEGMAFPLFSPVLGAYNSASQIGYGEEDAMVIIRYLDQMLPDVKKSGILA